MLMKYTDKFRVLLIQIFKIHRRKKVMVNTIKKHINIIAPGLWVINYNFAWKLNTKRPPIQFEKSKSYTISPLYRPIISRVRKLLEILIPPYFTLIRRQEEIHQSKTLIDSQEFLMCTSKEEPVFIDVKNKKVIRIVYDSDDLHSEVIVRAKLEEFLNTPKFEVSYSQNAILEEIVNGKSFDSISTESRIHSIKHLIGVYKKQSITYKSDINKEIWEKIFIDLEQKDMPELFKYKLKKYKNNIIEKSKSWPFILSHGDLYYNNILVDIEGVKLIDFDQSCQLPFFYDIINLIYSEALQGRADLMEAILHGSCNKEIKKFLGINESIEQSIELDLYLWAYIFFDTYRYPSKRFKFYEA